MDKKPTYEELEQKVRELEKEGFLLKKAKAEQIAGLAGISKDIAGRKQAEEALRESEERYRTLVENIPVAVYRNTPGAKGNFLMTNPAYLRMFGFSSKDELVGINVADTYMNAADRKVFSSKLLANGSVKDLELLLRKKDGSPFWGSVSARISKEKDGKDIYFDCMIMDITDRKRAEEALRESEEKYRSVIESSSDAILLIDKDRKIVSCNQASLDLFGYKKNEIEGTSLRIIHQSEESFRSFGEAAYPEIEKVGAFRTEWDFVSKDGAITSVETVTSVAKLPDGSIIGYIAIIRDITLRKKMLEERERLVKELQKMNKELQETTAQLIQSEKMSALGELTAGVAHELNQPLNGIKIISQSLLRDLEKNRFEEENLGNDLTDIVSQVNKMAEIVNHMRIYSRSTVGGQKEIIDVNKVIGGPFKILDQQLKNHHIEVIKELTPDLPKVVGDPVRLEQVFMNLIANARNAVESCGRENKRIEVRTYRTGNHGSAADNQSVTVEVKDNGEGVPEHLKEKIFQPFFTTREPGKGTGLGLSVSGKIIEEHRGRIELESQVGEGTTFRVILPIS